MKKIPLTQGKFALVDDEDFDWLNKHKWFVNKKSKWNNFYAKTYQDEIGCLISMHKMIAIYYDKKSKSIDHANHNGLDNRKSNLRFCTILQNNTNRGPHRNSSSKFKGVSWCNLRKKWKAQIKVDRKSNHIGLFLFEEDAARAYDKMAKKLFGEFAWLNFK